MNSLKKIIIYIFIFCFLPLKAYANENREAAYYLWRLINEARANPVQVLELVGIDVRGAKHVLGQKAWILDLEEGLPPLAWNQALHKSASSHNMDMVERVYYDSNSPEGLTPEERIAAQEYASISTGESLGAIAFEIYIEPIEAAVYIFTSMLKNELDPVYELPLNILNPDISEVGISFIETPFDLGDQGFLNIFIAVADFARPVDQRSFVIGNVYADTHSNLLNPPIDPIPEVELFVKFMPTEFFGEVSVPIGPMGSFQFEVPQAFFFIEARNKEGEILTQRNSLGYNFNQMLDVRVSPLKVNSDRLELDYYTVWN